MLCQTASQYYPQRDSGNTDCMVSERFDSLIFCHSSELQLQKSVLFSPDQASSHKHLQKHNLG